MSFAVEGMSSELAHAVSVGVLVEPGGRAEEIELSLGEAGVPDADADADVGVDFE